MNRSERRRSVKDKEKALRALGQVAGREYLLQMKEGKEPTAEKLFNGIDKVNRTALSNVGATDEEIMFVIQEATKKAENLGELDMSKSAKALKASLKMMKLMPKFMKINTKEQVLNDLGIVIGKEYKNARNEGKELGVEDLFKIQKDKWAIQGGGDMMEFYKAIGISEQDIRDTINETIAYWNKEMVKK